MAEDEPTFVTAAELREREARSAVESEGGGTDPGGTTDEFAIPARPDRRYPRSGGVEYVGGTVFSFDPGVDRPDSELADLLVTVLDSGSYRYGDWFDLPMPLYLVHDVETRDTFRVAVRDGIVEFHVRPDTEPSGLRALYDRLVGATGVEWSVSCRTE